MCELNRYYVYALLVGTEEESLIPFYIGKGCGKRLEHHFKPWSLKHKSYKNNKIIAAQKAGLILRAVKLWDNLSEEVALEIEQQEILWFNNTSIKLCNVYDGGIAKSYDKNLRKIEPKELNQLITSFQLKPGVLLLSDWIKHVQHVYTEGSAKNIYRGQVYEELRKQYPGFGGKMTEEQMKENRRRGSEKVKGDKNPMALPKLSFTKLVLAKLLCPIKDIQGLRSYVSSLGYSRPPLSSWPKPKAVKEPKPKVIKQPKPKVVKEPKPKIAYNALEKQQIMLMYLTALSKDPLKMTPKIFVKEHKLIVGYSGFCAWFNRSGVKKPKALGDKSAGGKSTALKTQRSIQQYKEGVLIEEYSSCHQAAKQLGYSQGNIRNVCEGVWKQAYGFEWRYKV